MELLDRIFTKRKLEYGNHDSRKRDRSCQITREQIRLLLFKECDWRGRKLLFDSSTIDKVPASKNDKPNFRPGDDAPCIVEVSDGYTYMYKGPTEDASILGEMIFGAVAMNYKGVSLKIHIMDEPRRLMCTKVFCVPSSRRISRMERKTSDVNSSGDVRHHSIPLNVPSLSEEGVSLSFSLDRGDSGYCGDQSPYSSVGSTYDYFSMFDSWDGSSSHDDFFFHSPPGRKLSTSSNGSWQRRTFQNVATRFDLSNQSSNLLSVPTSNSMATSDPQLYSNSSASGTSDSLASSGSYMAQRKNKLGLALLISVADAAEMDLVLKCVEHSPQLQAMVCRLRLATLAAGSGNAFVSTLYRAAADASRWLSDLMYGPRLQPVWRTLVTGDPRVVSKTADTLLADLCSVLSVGDTKHTNFFISTLLTHVLTYHLGWVTTVSPYDTLDPQKHTSDLPEPRGHYNALWAQLSDLCGSIGFPPRAARTVICGTSNVQFVNRLLAILTYFVRSGDVTRRDFKYQECSLKETNIVCVHTPTLGLKRTATLNKIVRDSDSLNVPSVKTQHSDSSVSTLVASEVSLKKCGTLANLSQKLSTGSEFAVNEHSSTSERTGNLKRAPTMVLPLTTSSDSSLSSSISDESEVEKKVVFVLGDNEKLVGLKNKSNDGKRVKKSSKVHNEPVDVEVPEEKKSEVCAKENCDQKSANPNSPSKCCGQTLKHSKPIKHSGFKFEFDKYPQIVTNYMKSKNLEILDRHYIGKPGNLKLDNFQFDPTVVPPIQEERCETCYKCQQLESLLQTPTNASEMEYMNDMPRQSEPQHAKVTVVQETQQHREVSPKTFVRKRKDNTIVVNLKNGGDLVTPIISVEKFKPSGIKLKRSKSYAEKPDLSRLEMGSLDSKSEPIRPERSKSNVERPDVKRIEEFRSLEDDCLELSKLKVDNCQENRIDSKIKTECKVLNVGLLDENKSEPHWPEEIKLEISNSEIDKIELDTLEVFMSAANNENNSLEIDKQEMNKQEITKVEISTQNGVKTEISTQDAIEPEMRSLEVSRTEKMKDKNKVVQVKQVIEFPMPSVRAELTSSQQRSGFDVSLLGGVTDHYVPDFILQGTFASPDHWETELRRDLDLSSYLNKTLESPIQAVAIIGDINTWEVRVVGRDCGSSGMSSLVGAMLDAVPAMSRAKVPSHQCLSFLEGKLRELCVLSKTMADMLMSTDFCDIATLTRSLNIDVNDVPLLLAVATTHTPQVATRYGISYRHIAAKQQS